MVDLIRPILVPLIALNATSTVFVPERYLVEVFRHLWLNVKTGIRERAPLIFLAAGRTGSGKSALLRECLLRLRVTFFPLSASNFESKWSNEPAGRIKSSYYNAATYQEEEGRLAAVLIDDLDLALGAFKDRSGTSNWQMANSTLMEVSDHPTDLDGEKVDRVPILGTVNNINVLYPPVVRPARTHVFEWNPSTEEERVIALHILRNYPPHERIEHLVSERDTWSISDYADLESALQWNTAFRPERGMSADEVLLDGLRESRGSHVEAAPVVRITDRQFETAVAEVDKARTVRLTNYLDA